MADRIDPATRHRPGAYSGSAHYVEEIQRRRQLHQNLKGEPNKDFSELMQAKRDKKRRQQEASEERDREERGEAFRQKLRPGLRRPSEGKATGRRRDKIILKG